MKALSDAQMHEVNIAAALLPLHERDGFQRSVDNRLSDIATPTDHDVQAAISFILICRGISIPSMRSAHGQVRRRHF
jgi:hypothetical protein